MNYTILKEIKNEIEVEKSRFIAFLFPCSSLDEFNKRMEELRKEYLKARHFCYAYRINNQERGSDDKEPKGTAGLPLLNCLKKNDLVDVAVIVVRIFGGTLLGSGRLLRTYVASFEEAYKLSEVIELTPLIEIEVSLTYDIFDTFKSYLKKNNFEITKTEFNDKINVSFLTKDEIDLEALKSKFLMKLEVINVQNIIRKG